VPRPSTPPPPCGEPLLSSEEDVPAGGPYGAATSADALPLGPPPASPAAASALGAALVRLLGGPASGATDAAKPVRLVLRHRLRWADSATAAAAASAVATALAATDGWARRADDHHRVVGLAVEPAVPEAEVLLVASVLGGGGAPPPDRRLWLAGWLLGPRAYLAAEAALVPWAYWAAAAVLSRRVEVVVDHVLQAGGVGVPIVGRGGAGGRAAWAAAHRG